MSKKRSLVLEVNVPNNGSCENQNSVYGCVSACQVIILKSADFHSSLFLSGSTPSASHFLRLHAAHNNKVLHISLSNRQVAVTVNLFE